MGFYFLGLKWRELAMLQYREGIADFTTVLTAEQNLLTQRDSLATTLGDISSNLVGVYRALGAAGRSGRARRWWHRRSKRPWRPASTGGTCSMWWLYPRSRFRRPSIRSGRRSGEGRKQ